MQRGVDLLLYNNFTRQTCKKKSNCLCICVFHYYNIGIQCPYLCLLSWKLENVMHNDPLESFFWVYLCVIVHQIFHHFFIFGIMQCIFYVFFASIFNESFLNFCNYLCQFVSILHTFFIPVTSIFLPLVYLLNLMSFFLSWAFQRTIM